MEMFSWHFQFGWRGVEWKIS